MAAVLSSIRLSDDKLDQLVLAIRDKFGNQQEYLDKTISETRLEYDNIKAQLKTLTYERLEAVKKGRGLTSEMFDQVTEELSARQHELDLKLNSLTNANFGFLTTLSHLLDLAQRANQLFQDADITTRNKLLRFLPANQSLYNKKLTIELLYPYKLMQDVNKKDPEGSNSTNWCG